MQTLQSISTKDLRDNLAEVLERVAIANESFIVCKFGKEKALLIPAEAQKTFEINKRKGKKLPMYGMWKQRKEMADSAMWTKNLRLQESLRTYGKKKSK